MSKSQIITTESGKTHHVSNLCGWLGVDRPDIIEKSFEIWSAKPKPITGLPIRAGGRSMLWEVGRKIFGVDSPNYAQEIGDPFDAGTMVLMADGSEKAIEDIKIGETVVNHKHELATVTNIIKKKFTGLMVTIHAKDHYRELTATETHHGMVVVLSDNRVERKLFGNMVVGDFVLLPFVHGNREYWTPYGLASPIDSISKKHIEDHTVYCITTENEFTAIFNGISQFQCVSFGAKNAIEYVQYFPIANGGRDIWTRVYPPYLYGCGRVYIGKGQMGNQDGSSGSWQADAVVQYGTIPIDAPNCPPYSGAIAKTWGYSGPPDEFVPIGKEHLIKTTSPVTTWDELVAALTNGYPVTVASNVGFDMLAAADGFHHYTTNWAHQLCIIGVDDDPGDPYGCVLNSWGCFSNDTEILTESGWLSFKDLPVGLSVATLNPTNHKLEYQVPTEYQEYDYQGEMYNFIGRDINQLVTPNHRMYHRPVNDRSGNRQWKMAEAKDMIRTCEFKKDCYWEGEEVEWYNIGDTVIKMDDWLEFLGYFISEGYTTISKRTRVMSNGELGPNSASRRVGISQKKEINIQPMQECLDKLSIKFYRTKDGWIATNKKLYEELLNLGKSHEKHIPDYVKKLSSRQQKILFDALMVGDGCYSQCPTGMKVTYYTSSPKLADDMQELLLKIGYAGDISHTNRIGRENTNGVTRYIEYRVGIKRTSLTPSKPNGGFVPILIPYNDKVYCVTVPNGIVFVRRNGRACWSGNSTVHGVIKDFKTGEIWPGGTLRVRKADIVTMLNANDSFAYSSTDLFVSQELLESDFDLW